MGLNTFSFIFLVSFRKKDFFLLARTRKFPTPPFILFPLVPFGTIQASEGEPRTKARTVLSVTRQPNTPARQIGFAHTTKTHFPDLCFARKRTVAFLQFFQGVGGRSGHRRGVSRSFQLAKFRLAPTHRVP